MLVYNNNTLLLNFMQWCFFSVSCRDHLSAENKHCTDNQSCNRFIANVVPISPPYIYTPHSVALQLLPTRDEVLSPLFESRLALGHALPNKMCWRWHCASRKSDLKQPYMLLSVLLEHCSATIKPSSASPVGGRETTENENESSQSKPF